MPGLIANMNLLRSRLRAVALAAAIVFAIRFVFSLFAPDSGEGFGGGAVVAACSLLSLGVASLLFSRLTLSGWQLRCVEYLFFGSVTLGILVNQYLIGSELIGRGDTVAIVMSAKNEVLSIVMVMIVYGVFIPNDPKLTARIVLTMAVSPGYGTRPSVRTASGFWRVH